MQLIRSAFNSLAAAATVVFLSLIVSPAGTETRPTDLIDLQRGSIPVVISAPHDTYVLSQAAPVP